MSKIKQITAQEGFKLGRKMGWCVCANCGMGLSFSDKEIIKNHISGKDCARDRTFFGMTKEQRFDKPGRLLVKGNRFEIIKPKAPH